MKQTLRNTFFVLLIPSVIALFNLLINPFDQWPLPRLESVNEKITETRWDVLIKSYQIQRNHYDTVILGNSRAAIALSPNHPAFATQSVYNYGLSGAGIYLQYLSLQKAVQTQPIKKLILTPDFFGFNATLPLNQPAAHGQADLIDLMSPADIAHPALIPSALSNTYANTLGWRGTNSSLRTLIAQNQKTVFIDRQGYWNRFGTKDRNYSAQFDRTERVYLTELLFPLTDA